MGLAMLVCVNVIPCIYVPLEKHAMKKWPRFRHTDSALHNRSLELWQVFIPITAIEQWHARALTITGRHANLIPFLINVHHRCHFCIASTHFLLPSKWNWDSHGEDRLVINLITPFLECRLATSGIKHNNTFPFNGGKTYVRPKYPV
jgi:hypothetical protein